MDMTKEDKAYAFLADLVNRFRQDIDNMKVGKEPMFPSDAINHMVDILTKAGKIIDE